MPKKESQPTDKKEEVSKEEKKPEVNEYEGLNESQIAHLERMKKAEA